MENQPDVSELSRTWTHQELGSSFREVGVGDLIKRSMYPHSVSPMGQASRWSLVQESGWTHHTSGMGIVTQVISGTELIVECAEAGCTATHSFVITDYYTD